MSEMIFLPTEQIKQTIREAVREEFILFEEKRKSQSGVTLLSRNAVAKRLHLSFNTVKKLVERGVLKTTKSGLIPEDELDRYLANS